MYTANSGVESNGQTRQNDEEVARVVAHGAESGAEEDDGLRRDEEVEYLNAWHRIEAYLIRNFLEREETRIIPLPADPGVEGSEDEPVYGVLTPLTFEDWLSSCEGPSDWRKDAGIPLRVLYHRDLCLWDWGGRTPFGVGNDYVTTSYLFDAADVRLLRDSGQVTTRAGWAGIVRGRYRDLWEGYLFRFPRFRHTRTTGLPGEAEVRAARAAWEAPAARQARESAAAWWRQNLPGGWHSDKTPALTRGSHLMYYHGDYATALPFLRAAADTHSGTQYEKIARPLLALCQETLAASPPVVVSPPVEPQRLPLLSDTADRPSPAPLWGLGTADALLEDLLLGFLNAFPAALRAPEDPDEERRRIAWCLAFSLRHYARMNGTDGKYHVGGYEIDRAALVREGIAACEEKAKQ